MINITLVICKKDVDFPFIPQARVLDYTLPQGVKRIYVINENCRSDSLHFFQERCQLKSDSNQLISVYDNSKPDWTERLIIHHGSEFQSPYFWRNLAIPFIDTELTMFIFNDVFPVKIQSTNDSKYDWILKLITAARDEPDYDVFQPWIWETKDKAHNFWKSLQFISYKGRLYIDHKYDQTIRKCTSPENLGYVYQNIYLEDHCYMVRTDFIRKRWKIDEQAAFTKEIRDMCLDVYYQKGEILGCYNSHVIYLKDDIDHQCLSGITNLDKEDLETCFSQDDLLYFSWRRSSPVCYKTFRYIEDKWGYTDTWDRINEKISFPRLNYFFNHWPYILATANEMDHHKVFLSLLLCLDFDQFKLVSPASNQHYSDFIDFYEDYLRYIKNNYEHNQIHIHAKRSSLTGYKPERDINYQSRYQFLEKGEKFTVRDGSRRDVSRITKNTQTPDSDLTIIQLNSCDQKLMNLLHEYLTTKMEPDFLVTLISNNKLLCFLRINTEDFKTNTISSLRKMSPDDSLNINFFSKGNDVKELKICLGKIKYCRSHIVSGKPSQSVIFRLMQKTRLKLTLKQMFSGKKYAR